MGRVFNQPAALKKKENKKVSVSNTKGGKKGEREAKWAHVGPLSRQDNRRLFESR